jgi:hypothetical protein
VTPRLLWPLLIALGSMAGSIGLGLWNRSGPETGGVELQSGRHVQVRGEYRPGDPRMIYLLQNVGSGWLDQPKLQSLGIEPRGRKAPLPRTVFLALEADSLLTVIDAGLDADSLERRYADRSRYLVLRGVIGLHRTIDQGIEGYVRGLLPPQIHLPRDSSPYGPWRLRAGKLRFPYVTR